MALVDDLKTIRDRYVSALLEDAQTPYGDYSLDGESVSQQAWREGMHRLIQEINQTIALYEPFEVRSYSV